jgi:hypoxanthine phosphoribosyltransferase
MEKIALHDKISRLHISHSELCKAVDLCASKINNDYQGYSPLFLSVLSGAFMFTSELMKRITIPESEISFIKLSSYQGVTSTGNVTVEFCGNKNFNGRDIIIVEDMVDTGCSMHYLVEHLLKQGAKSVKIAAMFVKPGAIKYPVTVDYYGMELENDFVVGFGLDYNEYGRHLPDLYVLDK